MIFFFICPARGGGMADAEDLKSRQGVRSPLHQNAAQRKTLDSTACFSLAPRMGRQSHASNHKPNRHHYRHRKSELKGIGIKPSADFGFPRQALERRQEVLRCKRLRPRLRSIMDSKHSVP